MPTVPRLPFASALTFPMTTVVFDTAVVNVVLHISRPVN